MPGRMNRHFRTVFLFDKKSCSGFISEFKVRQPRMLECLKDLEECAVQLDRMNKGSKISSVAGSSVGAAGGVLSIIGLALSPFTVGLSLGLTMTGVGLGITSGVNSLVTTATELGVNATQKKKVSEVFKVFMEDVQVIQDCLERVMNQAVSKMEANNVSVSHVVKDLSSIVYDVGKSIRSFFLEASNVKLWRKGLISGVQRATAEIPRSGQAAAKGSLAFSKSARAGFIAVNALFLGLDIFYICNDSISLAKGSETEVSQFIRARSALWSSEIDSWQKIQNAMHDGLQTSEKNEAFLAAPFYP